jgi:tripartite-type tricarboxylate transporter receptor subunit TctC
LISTRCLARRLLRQTSLRAAEIASYELSLNPFGPHVIRTWPSEGVATNREVAMRVMSLPVCAGLLAVTIAAPAFAESGADFFKDKTVTYIVATSPGGGYDTYGRLVAEYMQRHLPGSTFVVKNIPGAGHIIGANTLYAAKPDGLTIGTFNTGLIYNQLIHNDAVKFDLEKMSWIGKAANEPRIIAIAQQSPIASYKLLAEQKEAVTFSAAGVGSASYVETVILTNALKLPIKLLTGYNGNEDQMAMRRGEIVGTLSARSTWDPFVKNGYGRYIAQIGGVEKDVPQLASLVSDPDAQKLLALIQSQGDISRLTAGPPGIPADRLLALRTAYREAMEDKELLAKMEKLGLPVDPAYGDDVLIAIKAALNQTPETVKLLDKALNAK